MKQLFALIVALGVCNSSWAGEPMKLTLNWKAEPQFGGFYAAEKYFRQEKLSIQIIEGGSGTPTIQMLASGQTDFAVVSADEIVLSQDRGAKDVIALFATYQTNPTALMTRQNRGFHSLEDILKNEGTLLWQSGLPYAQYLLKKYRPLKVKTAPYLGGIGPFQSDPKISQQCFMTSEPLLAQKAGLKVETFLVADSGFNPYVTVLATRASYLKKNPKQIQKVLKAIRQGWSDYLKDPHPTNLQMAKINKAMDMETFKKSAEAQKPLIEIKGTIVGSMTAQRWTTLIDQLFEIKLIKNKMKAEDLFQNL